MFRSAAVARGWLPAGFEGDKRLVRDTLRLRPDGETDWMALQGEVYGPRMAKAALLDGVAAFLARCREAGRPVAIISHKTQFGHFDPTGTDLRQAALAWMRQQGFFDPAGFGLDPDAVFFAATRDEKVARIGAAGCGIFIDDLEEVLTHPAFPSHCRRLHLAGPDCLPVAGLTHCCHWRDVTDAVFPQGN